MAQALGLAIVREVVHLHGGRIVVDPERAGSVLRRPVASRTGPVRLIGRFLSRSRPGGPDVRAPARRTGGDHVHEKQNLDDTDAWPRWAF